MRKRLISLCLILSLLSCLPSGALADEYTPTGTLVRSVAAIEGAFSDGDYKDVSGEEPDAAIVLSGDTGTLSDPTRGSSGSTVTITHKGIYRVTGASDGVTIVVDDETESGNVYLVLEDVSMTNAGPCIVAEACDKLVIQCVGTCSLTMTAASGEYDAAIFARDDLTLNGTGVLAVVSTEDGIRCNDDAKITGATLQISAEGAGLRAKDSVRIGGGDTAIVSGKDGVHLENSAGDSWFYLENGSLSIDAWGDGIEVGTSGETMTGSVTLSGGSLSIRAALKGVKCQGDICVGEAVLSVDSTDDAIHSGASISLTGGEVTLESGDDGVHADSVLLISGGMVTVGQSYEGLEAYEVILEGGEVYVTASDDGVNAAGGSDSASAEAGPWAAFSSGSTGKLTVSGGTLYVNAGGDGLDSNGSLYVTGGLVIVEGPVNSGNGALDKGDGSGCVASITGGTVLAIGTADMAVNFDSGTQCSMLISLSGSAGDTITVDDGSGFSFTASKSFACVVYSSPYLSEGGSYTLSAGNSSSQVSFTSGLFYSDVSARGGLGGGFGGPGFH